MQAIIEGNLYEIEPAVKVIIDKLMIENAELKRENKRLEELYQKSIGVIAATDCVECKRYDSDVNRAISIIREFCRSNNGKCETCKAAERDGCMFVDYPDEWENLTALIDDGGADNE